MGFGKFAGIDDGVGTRYAGEPFTAPEDSHDLELGLGSAASLRRARRLHGRI
jgi:hypothetical protein